MCTHSLRLQKSKYVAQLNIKFNLKFSVFCGSLFCLFVLLLLTIVLSSDFCLQFLITHLVFSNFSSFHNLSILKKHKNFWIPLKFTNNKKSPSPIKKKKNKRLPGACNRSSGSKLLSITTQLHCGGHLDQRAGPPDTILEEDHPMTILSKFGSN